jgi:pimeloyl-ACP methyl ester carboxylesterase
MDNQLVRVKTSDSIELQGLHFANTPARKKVVIHLHGIWGNFYGNPFIDYFAQLYPQNGYDFVSANTRDHDDGSINAKFEQCSLDIDAWLNYLSNKGYENVFLQGHSLGAIKAVFYSDRHSGKILQQHVSGLILLSPFDNIPFYSGGDNKKRQEQVQRVTDLAQNDQNAMVPKDIWEMWPLSAQTYLDLVKENGSVDVFPFRRGTLDGSVLSRISMRSFVAVGGNDFAAYPSPEKEMELLSKLPRVDAKLIMGAPHNFAGREPNLLREIISWLKQLK